MFGSINLLYGENGRGKSTLARALRSATTGDGALLTAKKTIDGSEEQFVKISSDSVQPVVFHDGAWTGTLSEFEIFDSTFIEQNVYSGDVIGPGQRAQLLEFCIGEDAVRLQREFNELTSRQAVAQTRIREIETDLTRAAGPSISLRRFVVAQIDPELEVKLAAARRKLSTAEQRDRVLALPVPDSLIHSPSLDELIAALEAVPEIGSSASEQLVREHADHLDINDSLSWIEFGASSGATEECPFCGQSTIGTPLVDAYREFFTASFTAISRNLGAQSRAFDAAYGLSTQASVQLAVELLQSRVDAWSQHVDVADLDFSTSNLVADIRTLWELLGAVIERKRDDLAGFVIEPSTADRARQLSTGIAEIRNAVNESLDALRTRIATFRATEGAETVEALRLAVSALESLERRFTPETTSMVASYSEAIGAKELLEELRTAKREELDTSIATTMATYFEATSRILRSFSSSVSISAMRHIYSGGRPRMDYALSIRSREVGIDGYTFANTFSDGDRRSLALAFFLAKAQIDLRVANKSFYVDDPMSSLDRSRRSNTIEILMEIGRNAQQLTIASHDAHFLQDFRDRWLRQRQAIQPVVMQITAVGGGYSGFDDCDLDHLCMSSHVQRLLQLESYLDSGVPQEALRGVAQMLRPLLEGYLHRRFPSAIPRGTMLGNALTTINNAPAGSPLGHIAPSLPNMRALANYANQFHHDTNADADSAHLDEGELRGHAQSLVYLLYSGGLP